MKNGYLDIPLHGKKVKVYSKSINIELIEFDEFNPRISMHRDSHVLSSEGKFKINQEMVALFLRSQSSYNELKNSIRDSEGATKPIWVQELGNNKFLAIEGNTRLLIHKELQKEEEGDKYSLINCIILPPEITDEDKDYLRLVSHLNGQRDWDKYERAKYLYKLYEEQKYPIKTLTKTTKLSASDILQDIEAFRIMDEQYKEKYGESDIVHKFSYFKEFVKNKKLRKTMEDNKFTIIDFCDWVAKKKIERAMDVRKLYDILKEPVSRKVFINKDLDRAIDSLRDIIPEKSDKIYGIMIDLSKRIGQIELNDTDEIRYNPKSKKRAIVISLHNQLNKLLDEK